MDFGKAATQLCGKCIENSRGINWLRENLPTHGEDGILLWMSLQDKPVYAVDLSEHFSLTAGRVANLLRQLEKKEYLYREQDEDDLRKNKVVLTPKGRVYTKGLYERMHLLLQRVLLSCGEEQAQRVLEVAQELFVVIDQMERNHKEES